MIVKLNRSQLLGVALPVRSIPQVANLRLSYDQFKDIINHSGRFSILIMDGINGHGSPVMLGGCVRCAWGKVDKLGFTIMQINYSEYNIQGDPKYRDALIDNIVL